MKIINPTLHQIEAFVLACHLGSITAAAERMRLTQSAVSILLRQLERGLGAVALDHAQIAFLEQHADQRALPHVILDDKGGRWLTHRNLHCYVECRETNAHAPRRFLRNRRRIWMEKACG